MKHFFPQIVSFHCSDDPDDLGNIWFNLFPKHHYCTPELMKGLTQFLVENKIPFSLTDCDTIGRYWTSVKLMSDMNFVEYLIQEIKFPLLYQWHVMDVFKHLKLKNRMDLLPLVLNHFIECKKRFQPNKKKDFSAKLNKLFVSMRNALKSFSSVQLDTFNTIVKQFEGENITVYSIKRQKLK